MKKIKNLEERNKLISEKLLETIYLLEILEDLCESEAKEGTILTFARKNILIIFKQVEKCRKLISASE